VPVATLSIPPSVEHVRTARLVAVAAARRAGLDEDAVDDVRIAVGEAVARAVLRHGAAELDAHVDVVVRDDGHGLEVEVHDRTDASVADDDDGIALALVRALVPHTRIDGGTVTLGWPAAGTT
jgi:anti-sigma regulatory factor (Ser/Thr protein kinase)